MPSETCLRPGCTDARRPNQVMCRKHWFEVPKPLRDAIWDAYRRKDRAGSMAHIREAVRLFVEQDMAA